MLKRIKSWFKSFKCDQLPYPKRTILEPKPENVLRMRRATDAHGCSFSNCKFKAKQSYFCDVCKEPAKHIAIVDSDTGKHVIGAKCDEHINMVIQQMLNEKFSGTRMQESQPVHFAGFKSDKYSEWYECSCPKSSTHYILSDDVRLLNAKGKP